MSVELVEVLREDVVESVHRGSIAVVNTEGEVLFEMGDINKFCYFRSTSKPFQVIAALNSGVGDLFDLNLKEIAVSIASHSGEDEHIEALTSLVKKIGINKDELMCSYPEHSNIYKDNQMSKLYSVCSGKHIILIGACKALGLEHKWYYKKDHAIYKLIGELIGEFSNYDSSGIKMGTDGCGVPVYGVPLKNIAQAYSNLCNMEFMDKKYKRFQSQVISAMISYPQLIAGKGKFDTVLMKHFGDRLVCKYGEEGIYSLGLIGKGVGIALKIDDGNMRGVAPAVIQLLLRLKIIRKDEIEELKDFFNPVILNNFGEKVGEIRAVLEK